MARFIRRSDNFLAYPLRVARSIEVKARIAVENRRMT